MKKDVLKKIAAALSFMTLAGTHTITLHAATQMSNAQTKFISSLVSKLEGFVKFTTDWTDEFFNTKNKESYNVHVNRMKKKLAEFEREIVQPIKKQRITSDTYGKTIAITKNVINQLHKQMKEIYEILDNNRGKGAFRLGLAFRKVEKYSRRSAVNKLKNQLKEIQRLLNTLNPALGKKVTAILAQVEKQIQKNETRSNWEAFKALKHRFACKGGPASSRSIATTIAANATPREVRQAAAAAKQAAREKARAERRAKRN